MSTSVPPKQGPSNEPISRARRRALVALLAAWAGVMALLVVSPNPPIDLEAWLFERFPPRHEDAYDGVNRLASLPFLAVLLTWIAVEAVLLIAKTRMLVLVNLLGPAVAALFVLPATDFSDPSWFLIGAVLTIGCFVGLLVTGVLFVMCYGCRTNREQSCPGKSWC